MVQSDLDGAVELAAAHWIVEDGRSTWYWAGANTLITAEGRTLTHWRPAPACPPELIEEFHRRAAERSGAERSGGHAPGSPASP